ncbi:UTRA domain-containing protein [Tabrizicola sp.]|uniref:UTRA domain-containing protein n=1 Tax=Tabrizicola sp. TaxID=2005166 RepID=UPI00286ACB2A|nr:UTRA domain-containing protein [Tabrizicola sp.]
MAAPVPVAARMGLPEGVALRYLETLHLAGGRPYVFECRWLNPAVLPDPGPDFAALSANEWLVTHVSLVSGDIAFSAEPALAREAVVLGVAPGVALFITERMTFGLAGPVTFVRLAHAPGHRVQMVL